MYTDANFCDIVFRLTIFSLLVYKLWQLSNKYLIPFLKEQMQLEKNKQMELLEKEKLLISTRHRIENQIYSQKKMFVLLEKNVQIWHRALQDERAKQLKENKDIVNQIHEKRLQQRKNLTLKHEVQESVDRIFQHAEIKLDEMYEGLVGEQYLKQIVKSFPIKSR